MLSVMVGSVCSGVAERMRRWEPGHDTHLVEAGGQARLLGGGEDERLVVTLDHLVRDPLEVPRPLADAVRPHRHLDHVVLAHGAQRLGRGVVGGSGVLQEADGLLPPRCILIPDIQDIYLYLIVIHLSRGEGVDHEAEGGGLALGLLPAPALALVQRQVADGVVGLPLVVQVSQLLERHAACSRGKIFYVEKKYLKLTVIKNKYCQRTY